MGERDECGPRNIDSAPLYPCQTAGSAGLESSSPGGVIVRAEGAGSGRCVCCFCCCCCCWCCEEEEEDEEESTANADTVDSARDDERRLLDMDNTSSLNSRADLSSRKLLVMCQLSPRASLVRSSYMSTRRCLRSIQPSSSC